MSMVAETKQRVAETMRLIQADCKQDALALDATPFTPRGVGESLGSTLAMLAAVARAVECLAEAEPAEVKP